MFKPPLAGTLLETGGELDDQDKHENDISLEQGLRLLSAYTDRGKVRFWIITEADRSVTTVLLPSDY